MCSFSFAGGGRGGDSIRGRRRRFVAVAVIVAGVVVDRKAVEGEVVDSKTALFGVADTSRLWLMLNLRQEDARYVSLGQTALFRTSESANEPDSKGIVGWDQHDADDVTRTSRFAWTLPMRMGGCEPIRLARGGLCCARTQGDCDSSDAIHWDGTCNVCFCARQEIFLQPEAPRFFMCGACGPG